jgi:hypothetical protein
MGQLVPDGDIKPCPFICSKEKAMAIMTVGIDLAKSVFAVDGVGDSGKPELLRPEVRRHKLKEFDWGAAALPDRHESLLGRPSLGSGIRENGPHGAPDCLQIQNLLLLCWLCSQSARV